MPFGAGPAPSRMQPFDSDAPTPLDDLALLGLVMAHGTDADLDPRETTAVVHQLTQLAEHLGEVPSGQQLSLLVERAVERYAAVRVSGLDVVVARLGQSLGPAQLARVHAALVEVADADGVRHTMETTLLRHLAQAWGLGGA